MTLKLYRYHEDFGRMGYLSGTFVADDADVEKALGQSVYLGEVLGKHSDISATIVDETLTVLTDDQDFIKKFHKFQCDSGQNPVAALLDQ
jgi:hypothetical protein